MDAIAEIHSELPILSDMPDTTAMPETLEVLPIAEPKRKPGRPAGSKNKTCTQKVAKEEVESPPPPRVKRPRTPSPTSPKPRPRTVKKRGRTRVVILSSSESDEAPPLVRVVRKPRAVVNVASSSSDEEVLPARPPPATVAPLTHFEADIRANHQQHLAARRKTYDAYFQHLR